MTRTWEELSRRIEQRDRIQGQVRKSSLLIEQFVQSLKLLAEVLQPSVNFIQPVQAVAMARQLHTDLIRMQQISVSRLDQEKHKDELKKPRKITRY